MKKNSLKINEKYLTDNLEEKLLLVKDEVVSRIDKIKIQRKNLLKKEIVEIKILPILAIGPASSIMHGIKYAKGKLENKSLFFLSLGLTSISLVILGTCVIYCNTYKMEEMKEEKLELKEINKNLKILKKTKAV